MTQKLSGNTVPTTTKGRAWTFTLNNYTKDEINKITVEIKNDTYVVFGHEVGESGTPHLQGYIHFKNARSFRSVKKLIGERSHIEIARGSADENFRYCTKEDKDGYYEAGERPAQGKRVDIDEFVKDIEKGVDVNDLWEKHPACMLKYRHARADRIKALNSKKKRSAPEIKVLIGPPRSGKTRFAYETEGDDLWAAPGDFKWFDGYEGQDAVLFDDYNGQIEYEFFLRLTDRYKLLVPVKGDYTWWLPKRIYITSNKTVEQWYPGRNVDALRERFREFDMDKVPDSPISDKMRLMLVKCKDDC